MKRKTTKKKTGASPGMRREYSFRASRPNKYAAKFAAGTNLVLIDRDLFKLFPDAQAVNDALRGCAAIVRSTRRGK